MGSQCLILHMVSREWMQCSLSIFTISISVLVYWWYFMSRFLMVLLIILQAQKTQIIVFTFWFSLLCSLYYLILFFRYSRSPIILLNQLILSSNNSLTLLQISFYFLSNSLFNYLNSSRSNSLKWVSYFSNIRILWEHTFIAASTQFRQCRDYSLLDLFQADINSSAFFMGRIELLGTFCFWQKHWAHRNSLDLQLYITRISLCSRHIIAYELGLLISIDLLSFEQESGNLVSGDASQKLTCLAGDLLFQMYLLWMAWYDTQSGLVEIRLRS